MDKVSCYILMWSESKLTTEGRVNQKKRRSSHSSHNERNFRKGAWKNSVFDGNQTLKFAEKTLVGDTTNWATQPHVENEANFRGGFLHSHREIFVIIS